MNVTDKIRLFHIDNMEFMKSKPDGYYDLVLTDIPYGIDAANMSYVKERKNLVKQKNGTKLSPYKNKKIKAADWDKELPTIEYFNEIKRISKHQIFFGVDYVDWDLGKGRIKWNKGFAEGMSFNKFEIAYCSFIDYEKQIDYLWAGMMQGKSHFQPMIQQGNKSLNEERKHPTHKPIILWDLIFLFCIENNIDISKCIDTNSGLCSSALSSLNFNQVIQFDCLEINETYYNESVKRVKNHVNQLKMF